jgi:tRNA-dihydrouridine synthase B
MVDQPLVLGGRSIQGRLWLAPMAGVTDLPFRVVAAELGCPFSVTEMVSAKGIYYGGKTLDLLQTDPAQGPGLVQLFGREPQLMADMAKRLFDQGLARDGIDINMGCPAPKIVKNGEGSALLLEPQLCGEIISAIKKAVPLPVTAKIRRGFQNGQDVVEELCPILEEAGADAVAIHGRTRDQMYAGRADWDCIRRAKALLRVPVIGNGDVASRREAEAHMAETGCDGVLVGRGAFGNPFLFSKRSFSLTERLAVIERHLDLTLALRGERVGVPLMRKHMCAYLKGVRGGAKARTEILSANTREEILAPMRRTMLAPFDKEER